MPTQPAVPLPVHAPARGEYRHALHAHAAAGAVLAMPISHGEGKYHADAATLERLRERGGCVSYATPDGRVVPEAKPMARSTASRALSATTAACWASCRTRSGGGGRDGPPTVCAFQSLLGGLVRTVCYHAVTAAVTTDRRSPSISPAAGLTATNTMLIAASSASRTYTELGSSPRLVRALRVQHSRVFLKRLRRRRRI